MTFAIALEPEVDEKWHLTRQMGLEDAVAVSHPTGERALWEGFERGLSLIESEANGICYCQGNFAAMGVDVPETIRLFGQKQVIHFVHFRDVRGTADDFVETFHDEGKTDMFAAMGTYREIGFDGAMRPDHAPAMYGDPNTRPGYEARGRLFAIGYMKGLLEGVDAVRRSNVAGTG